MEPSNIAREFERNFSQCPICEFKFSRAQRKPLIICTNHHTICLKCLQELKGQPEPRCPFCREDLFLKKEMVNNYIFSLLPQKDPSSASRDIALGSKPSTQKGPKLECKDERHSTEDPFEESQHQLGPHPNKIAHFPLPGDRPEEPHFQPMHQRQAQSAGQEEDFSNEMIAWNKKNFCCKVYTVEITDKCCAYCGCQQTYGFEYSIEGVLHIVFISFNLIVSTGHWENCGTGDEGNSGELIRMFLLGVTTMDMLALLVHLVILLVVKGGGQYRATVQTRMVLFICYLKVAEGIGYLIYYVVYSGGLGCTVHSLGVSEYLLSAGLSHLLFCPVQFYFYWRMRKDNPTD